MAIAGGFFQIDNSVLDLLPTIKPTGLAAYAYLCRCADADGRCFPSQEKIGDVVGVKERQVRNILATLEDEGLIRVEKQFGGDARRVAYIVTRGNERPEDTGNTGNPATNNRQYITGITGNTGNTLPTYKDEQDPENKNHHPSRDDDFDPMGKVPLKAPAATLTSEQAQVARVLTESVMLGRSHCVGLEGAMWQKLFAAGLTLDIGQRVIDEVLERKKTPGRPSAMTYFQKPLQDALEAEPPIETATQTLTAAEIAAQDEERQQREIANRERGRSILAESQARFAAAQAAKANRYGSAVQ